jgi:hypothetical protein
MNKNHLLPAMLFVLAACGGTASSSSSAPASSSAFQDANEYRIVGSSQALSAWTPANALVMTRAAGTNTFSRTLDLFEADQWKLVIGTDWANGTVSAKTPGISIVDNGETWAKDEALEFVVPDDANTITVDDNNGGLNFETAVDGNYTVTFVSSSPLSKSLTILRNGNPLVPPPTPEVDPANWFLVGSITDDGSEGSAWNPANKEFAMTPVAGQTGVYDITLSVEIDDLFKIKTGDTWSTGRDLGFGAITLQPSGVFGNDSGNIKALASGTFRIVFTFAPSAGSITVESTGWIGYGFDVTETPTQTTIGYVGPDPFWNKNAQLNLLTPFNGTKQGVEFTFTGKAGDTYLFKVEARGGIFKETPVVATGSEQSHIVSLASFTEAQRNTLNLFIVFVQSPASEGTIVLNDWNYVDTVEVVAPEWVAVGGVNVTTDEGAMTMGYTTDAAEWWNTHAKIEIVGFDGTDTTVTVTFTGVAGHRYVFKFEGPDNRSRMEYGFDATGVEQVVTIDLTLDKDGNAITEASRSEIDLFVVFCATVEVTGTVTVEPLVYSAE